MPYYNWTGLIDGYNMINTENDCAVLEPAEMPARDVQPGDSDELDPSDPSPPADLLVKGR